MKFINIVMFSAMVALLATTDFLDWARQTTETKIIVIVIGFGLIVKFLNWIEKD